MLRNTLKFAKFIVGGHLLLGLALIVTEATHGINDQDPSFALALLVHYMNLPSVWLLNWLGVPNRVIAIVLAGVLQWAIIAFAMAAAFHYFRAMMRVVTRQVRQTPEHSASFDAVSPAEHRETEDGYV